MLFKAAIEATEEAILNSLFMAVTTRGFGGHVRHAVPLDYVRARLRIRPAATANSQRQISRPQWVLTRNVPSGPNGMRAHTAWVKRSGSGIAWARMLST